MTTWKSRQLESLARAPTNPPSHAATRWRTASSSRSQIHGLVSCRAIAIEAASTIGWARSAMGGQRSAPSGSVPAASPAAYRSISSGGTRPPEPAIRQAASRNERAYPSRPSDQDPAWPGRPGSRYWANFLDA